MSLLKLAVYNGTKNISSLNEDEIKTVREAANGMLLHERTLFLEKLMQPLVPAFQAKITSPTWLQSDFDESIWKCTFGTIKKTIDFNVLLEDGIALTDSKHHKLLYTLKYWFCSQTHPRYCGGKNLKSTTAYTKILACIQLTDALLLRKNHFQLSKHGLQLFTENDALALVECMMNGVADGFYQSGPRVTDYLLQHIEAVTDKDIVTASKNYPYILRKTDEALLGLTNIQIIKARVWLLDQKGAFQSPSSVRGAGSCKRTFFQQRIYKNTLNGKDFHGCIFPELRITPLALENEYQPIPITNREEDGTSIQIIKKVVRTLKSLNVVTGDSFVGVPAESLERLSVKHVTTHFIPKDLGRFRTLPAPVVFTALNDAFEFCFKYMDDILEAMLKSADKIRFITDQKIKKAKHLALNTIVQNNISPMLREIGVQRWRIVDPNDQAKLDPELYNKLRSNNGLLELYEVLMGSIQIIIGTMMARRVSELQTLKTNCLYPMSDPTTPENKNTNYSLEFYNSKSGAGDTREKLIRPIPKTGALFIWKLQQFQHKLIKMGAIQDKAGLLITCCRRTGRFAPIAVTSYRRHFDIFCDYFETPLLEVSHNQLRRYYIRQHQLRRFLAMSFYWSSGFDGLDTLRYLLGHTDAEHLYHYITEITPGEVLRGVKAETLVHGLNADKIKGIEKLREILKKRFNVQDVTVEALDEAIKELQCEVEDGYIQTTPELNHLRNQLEVSVDKLLSEGVIDLQPYFCTVQDPSGEIIQKINLVLTIKEVEYGSDQ